MNKSFIAIVIAAVVLVSGYFLLRSPGAPAPSSNLAPQPVSLEAVPPGSAETPAAQETPPTEKNLVAYTDAGYSPSTLNIKAGETVIFKNESSKAMWTASALHPSHRVYPTTGGCLGSTFDACAGIEPGASWSFKFDVAGSWKYHDHLLPGQTGTIVVEK